MTSGLEWSRRRAALKGVAEAIAQATAVQGQWVRTPNTTGLVALLDPVIAKLLQVSQVLSDENGEHWDMAPQLRLIEDELAALDRMELAGVLGYVDDAWNAIASHQ